MKEQLPLPGVPPGEEQASAEATAETVLIFDADDVIERRVVQALRDLFWGTTDNDRDTFVRNRQAFTDMLAKPIKALIAKEIQAHINQLKEVALKSRGMPKGPRK